MKSIILALCVIFILPAFSFSPPNPCGGYFECTDMQLQIWDKFQTGVAPLQDHIPSVYSGGCYHLSQYYNGEDKHYGVVMLDSHNDNLYNYGRYGFFYEENPYRDMTVEDFRNQEGFSYSTKNILMWEKDGAMADYSETPDKIWRYYFRQDISTKNLLVIGFWTPAHILMCEFLPHL